MRIKLTGILVDDQKRRFQAEVFRKDSCARPHFWYRDRYGTSGLHVVLREVRLYLARYWSDRSWLFWFHDSCLSSLPRSPSGDSRRLGVWSYRCAVRGFRRRRKPVSYPRQGLEESV